MDEKDLPPMVRANLDRRAERRSASFISVYANDTQFMTTPWDIRLTFGQIMDIDTDSKKVEIEAVAEVRMSPQHAKRVAEVLTMQIRQYEANIGPIPMPDDGK